MSRTILIVGGSPTDRNSKAESYFSGLLPHPDFLIVAPNPSIGIEEVRTLEHQIFLRPYSEKEKVIHIREAQFLTPEAQNALLKTLEEPPAHITIILSAPSETYLLQTVISRCQVIKLPLKPQTLSNEDTEKMSLLLSIPKKSLGEGFEFLAKLTPTKESAISWIEENQRLLWYAFHLSQKGGIKSVGCKNREYIIIQKVLEEVKRYVTQNVSPRFVLENFFLKISNLYSQKH